MYTGLTGKVIIKTKGDTTSTAPFVAYISNWSVEDTTDVIEVTRLGYGYKEKLPGLQGWSASADGAVEFALVKHQPNTEVSSGQAELFAAKHKGDIVYCEFVLDDKTDTKFFGNGIIESLSIDLSAEDKGNISISINGIGILERL